MIPPLHPPRNGLHLGAADPLPHLVLKLKAYAAESHGRNSAPYRKEAARVIWDKGSKGQFSMSPVLMRLRPKPKHDVIAFLTHLAEIVGPEARFRPPGQWTSSDVLDTCFQCATQARRRHSDCGCGRPARSPQEARLRTQETRQTIGRSHGIHAEAHNLRPQAGPGPMPNLDRCKGPPCSSA